MTTNADGRTDGPVLAPADAAVGNTSRIPRRRFYAAARTSIGDPVFLDSRSCRCAFALRREAALHVPLLCTPWSLRDLPQEAERPRRAVPPILRERRQRARLRRTQ